MPLLRLLTTDEGSIAHLHVKSLERREKYKKFVLILKTIALQVLVSLVYVRRAATPARVGSAKPSVAQNSSGQRALKASSPRATTEYAHRSTSLSSGDFWRAWTADAKPTDAAGLLPCTVFA